MQKTRIFTDIIIVFMLSALLILALPIETITASSISDKVFYSGNKDNKSCSLMVNVYWGTEYLDDMLEIMDCQEVKCTFFVGGIWVEKNQEMLKKIVESGHEIGNHGYLHKDHDKISDSRQRQEIKTTHDLVKAVCGIEMNLFAPPSGAYNKATVQIANELNYNVIMWTLDTIDWRDKNADLIFKRATKKLENGNLILMHPTAKTVEALPNIINVYKNSGFSIVSVSENIGSAG